MSHRDDYVVQEMKAEFDKLETLHLNRMSLGEVANQEEYRELVGQVKAIRALRNRMGEIVTELNTKERGG